MAVKPDILKTPYPYLLIILIGTGFKVAQIDQGFFWGDEVATIFHVNGQDATNFFDPDDAEVIRPYAYYVDQLHLSRRPDSELGRQLGRLALKPQFTPLHYAYLTLWYRLFGDEPITYRWFSLFFYFIVLVVLYFLGKELFGTTVGGWVAASLFSVSPYFHLFAILARYPMLSLLACFLANLFLLYALKTERKAWWLAYALALAHAMYVSFLSVLLLGAHLIFVAWKVRAQIKPYLIATSLALLAYLPWILLLMANYGTMYQAMEWHKYIDFSFWQSLKFQLANSSILLADLSGLSPYGLFFNMELDAVQAYLRWTSVLWGLCLAGLLYFLVKKGSGRSKGLILPLIAAGSLFLFWSDIFRGTFLSAIPHYQLLSQSGIFLAIAFLFAEKIGQRSWLFAGLFIVCAGLGLYSIARLEGKRCMVAGGDCPEQIAKARVFEEPGSKLFIIYLTENYVGEYMLSILNETHADEQLDVLAINKDSKVLSLIPPGQYDHVYLYLMGAEKETDLKKQLGDRMYPRLEGASGNLWEIR